MKRNGLWLIGLFTAALTVFSLTAIFGRQHWKHFRHPGHYWRYDNDCMNERDSARGSLLHDRKYHEESAPQ